MDNDVIVVKPAAKQTNDEKTDATDFQNQRKPTLLNISGKQLTDHANGDLVKELKVSRFTCILRLFMAPAIGLMTQTTERTSKFIT